MVLDLFHGLGGQIVAGLVAVILLVLSAEFVVGKLIHLARHWGVSNTFMGMTVLSLGTSLPEIASHLVASMGILTDTLDYKIASSAVLGANIGSDVIQQTFVLGLVVFIMGSLTFSKNFLKRNYSMMIATTLMTLILGWDGTISRFDGFILLATFFWYMWFLYKKEDGTDHVLPASSRHLVGEVLLVLGGLLVLFLSSSVALRATEAIVHATGIGGSLIGVLTLGVAAALPEMSTAFSGLRKKATGISLGTLIGSNIVNPLVAIGLGGMLSTYYVPKPLVYWDLPMETITAALLLVWLFFNKRKLGRAGAIYLMLLYVFYLVIRITFFSVD